MTTSIYKAANGIEWIWDNNAGTGVANSFQAARIAAAKALAALAEYWA